jgi:hypothetical protein
MEKKGSFFSDGMQGNSDDYLKDGEDEDQLPIMKIEQSEDELQEEIPADAMMKVKNEPQISKSFIPQSVLDT